jgi:hypothetical protein
MKIVMRMSLWHAIRSVFASPHPELKYLKIQLLGCLLV